MEEKAKTMMKKAVLSKTKATDGKDLLCVKLTDCKACASQPHCKWKMPIGECKEHVKSSIVTSSGSYHMAPECCPAVPPLPEKRTKTCPKK